MTRPERRTALDGDHPFDITVFDPGVASRTVLFAVGAGGDPERHGPLLKTLAENGCLVVAPHFDRLTTPFPTIDDLATRTRRLIRALDVAALPDRPVGGVGHSLGASLLIGLAGGRLSTRDGDRWEPPADPRIDRLVLLAPATDFFRGSGALDQLATRLLVWVGGEDTITPSEHAERLVESLEPRVDVELRVSPGVGHFSFLDELPPGVGDPLPDRAAFLAEVAGNVADFLVAR